MKKESDLYKPLKNYFESQFYEVYAEVTVPLSGGRVDLVAYSKPAAIAVEMKTSLTIDLVEQAIKRQVVFPIVYIAIPKRRKGIADWLLKYLTAEGIGIIEVWSFGRVEISSPARYRKPKLTGHKHFKKRVVWDQILKPEHQTWVDGGSAGGGYVTDYRITMKGIRHYLAQKAKLRKMSAVLPGGYEWASVAEIVQHCETHYSSPKNGVAQALLNFEGSWVEAKKINGKWMFRHKESGLI